MVFSSLPPYLDPSNWHQAQNHPIIGSGGDGTANPRFVQTPAAAAGPHGGAVRPGSMSERARMANIPMPEAALKCPRCESTNTKFCYFNNYSLSQPRHFCKTCRRYWTRGGALRNVPVGGGCRRNKRSKSSTRSKSPASGDVRQTNSSSTTPLSGGSGGSLLPFPPLRFGGSQNFSGELGVNYSGNGDGTMGMNDTGFQLGGNTNLMDPWRFPILSGMDPAMYHQFHEGGELGFVDSDTASVRPKLSTSFLSQLAAVKMEENQAAAAAAERLGMVPLTDHHHHQWNGNGNWNEISSTTTSSSHQLHLHLEQ